MRLALGVSAMCHVIALTSALFVHQTVQATTRMLPVDVALIETEMPPPAPVEPEQKPPPPPLAVRAPRPPDPVVAPKPVDVPHPLVPPVMVAQGEGATDAKDTFVQQDPPKLVDDQGTLGGVPGGVPGGVIGGRVAPPPPPPPSRPVQIDMEYARKKRLAGRDPPYPRRAEANGTEGLVVVKLVIDPAGRVTQTVFLQGHPAFDDAVRSAIAGWRFAPHLVNGVAVPVYTVFRFTFKLA